MNHILTIKTDRLDLKPLSMQDSERFRILRNREENRKCFVHSDIISKKQQQAWYRKYLENETDFMFSVYTLCGNFAGACALYDVDRTSRKAEFGRLLIDRTNPANYGLGYYALTAACRIASEQLQLDSLCLEVYENNIAARKTYEKAGFFAAAIHQTHAGDNLLYMEKSLR